MARTAQDYFEIAQALLPPGAAWPRDPAAVLSLLLRAIAAEESARVDASAEDIVEEADPRTAFEMLAEWEALCGLPSQCLGPLTTLQERRQAVVNKWTAEGGQSPAYMVALAASLGYTISVEEFKPMRAGFRAGARCYGAGWAYVWRVHSQGTSITYFRAGQSCAGERLRTWGDRKLECALQEVQPSYTDLIFAYDN